MAWGRFVCHLTTVLGFVIAQQISFNEKAGFIFKGDDPGYIPQGMSPIIDFGFQANQMIRDIFHRESDTGLQDEKNLGQ